MREIIRNHGGKIAGGLLGITAMINGAHAADLHFDAVEARSASDMRA